MSNYDYTVFHVKADGSSGNITLTPSPVSTPAPTRKPSVTPTKKPVSTGTKTIVGKMKYKVKKIKKIGTKAFYGCKKLKKIVINTKQLQAKKVGNRAFQGIYAKVNVKVSKAKLKSYKNFLMKRGIGKRAKIHA